MLLPPCQGCPECPVRDPGGRSHKLSAEEPVHPLRPRVRGVATRSVTTQAAAGEDGMGLQGISGHERTTCRSPSLPLPAPRARRRSVGTRWPPEPRPWSGSASERRSRIASRAAAAGRPGLGEPSPAGSASTAGSCRPCAHRPSPGQPSRSSAAKVTSALQPLAASSINWAPGRLARPPARHPAPPWRGPPHPGGTSRPGW